MIAGVALASVSAVLGCGAVYQEVAVSVRQVPPGKTLEPPPPPDVVFLAFEGANIPPTSRDGRKWSPDPFAKLVLNEKEILRTPVQSNTLKPTWPGQQRSNHHIPKGSSLKLELWDSNAINNHPICVRTLRNVERETEHGRIDVECESGARVRLIVEPARAKMGLGFWYELRNDEVWITRTIQHSPAARAGLRAGDQILKIQGREVRGMDDGQPRSLINTNSRTGLDLLVRHADGRTETVKLMEGPIYPLPNDNLAVD
jgi:hypothetical protein